VLIRPLQPSDRSGWQPLWDAYNEFYGRVGHTALDPAITQLTWGRLFEPDEPMWCSVAVDDGHLVGLVHYLFHRSTTQAGHVCYLQDLFIHETQRGRGIGRALVDAVYEAARTAGTSRVYWHTQSTNAVARRLYDEVAAHSGFIVYAAEIEGRSQPDDR
jgi:GNAT superfamily N-acetyltransferase